MNFDKFHDKLSNSFISQLEMPLAPSVTCCRSQSSQTKRSFSAGFSSNQIGVWLFVLKHRRRAAIPHSWSNNHFISANAGNN